MLMFTSAFYNKDRHYALVENVYTIFYTDFLGATTG